MSVMQFNTRLYRNKVIGVNMRKSSKNNTKSAKNQKQEKSNQNEKACK